MGTYNLGTVGSGHWVKRLHEILKQHQEIKIVKAVGTRAFNDKKGELERYGISEDRYYRINTGDPLPDTFFKDLDIVHIASPNQFHMSQTMQSLEMDKVTITEKAFATSKEDFDKVVDFVKENGYGNKVTLRLHYLSKTLTNELAGRLPQLIEDHGKIKNVNATFLEKTSEEDARRSWLFKPENGGIFMDWIHPLSIIIHIMKPENIHIEDVKTYIVRPEFDPVNPTAVDTTYRLNGDNFSDSSMTRIRIGKGLDIGLSKKQMEIVFEDGASLHLQYLNTEEEFSTGKMGVMEIEKNGKIIESVEPVGPLSYEVLIKEVLGMLEGGKPYLTIDDATKIYDPVWKFQEISKQLKPIQDTKAIQNFVASAIKI